MQVTVRGRNLDVSESLRSLVESKLKKLERFVDELTAVEVDLARVSARSGADRNRVDVKLLSGRGPIIHGQARGADIRSALEEAIDAIERQTIRHKERLQERGHDFGARSAAALAGPDVTPPPDVEIDEGAYPAVVTVQLETKPQTLDEALDQFRLSGRPWTLFISAETQVVHMLERQPDGTFVQYIPVPE